MRLEPDWALQDPNDYLRGVPARRPRRPPAERRRSGRRHRPGHRLHRLHHAAHHGRRHAAVLPARVARPPARLGQAVEAPRRPARGRPAQRRSPASRATALLDRYGGKISSEWFFPKALQILDEAPEVYAAADRLIEAADWVVWQLTGEEKRNACTAGYKAMWSKRDGFPPNAYFEALDPRLERVVDDKMSRTLYPLGEQAGGLTATGGRAGPGCSPARRWRSPTSTRMWRCRPRPSLEPGRMVMIMGTSPATWCWAPRSARCPGICGFVEDGIMPGLLGLRGRPVLRGRQLRLVRRALRAGGVRATGARRAGWTSTSCWRRRPRSCSRASPACWRSTGGTATARCWWTPT